MQNEKYVENVKHPPRMINEVQKSVLVFQIQHQQQKSVVQHVRKTRNVIFNLPQVNELVQQRHPHKMKLQNPTWESPATKTYSYKANANSISMIRSASGKASGTKMIPHQ